MKSVISKGIFATLIAITSLSCASTPKNESQKTASPPPQMQEEQIPALSTESELYEQKAASSKITILSSPKETTKGKIFTTPYILKAEDVNGNPIDSYEISVIYPSSRKNGEIVFSETAITTNSEGKAEFLPPLPTFSFNSEISFFPKNENQTTDEAESTKITEIASAHTIKAPFKVQTNQKSAGGTIELVDFNQNGKAITSNPISSSNLLMTLMKLGFTRIGNAPQEVMDAVIQNNESKIFARAKSIAPSFIIFGTVKIDSTEKTDAGFSYTLSADVKSMNSKTGEITFKMQKTVTVTDKNDWNALDKARKTLANEIANEIRYGI